MVEWIYTIIVCFKLIFCRISCYVGLPLLSSLDIIECQDTRTKFPGQSRVRALCFGCVGDLWRLLENLFETPQSQNALGIGESINICGVQIFAIRTVQYEHYYTRGKMQKHDLILQMIDIFSIDLYKFQRAPEIE